MIDVLTQRCELLWPGKVTGVVGDLESATFPSSSFDLIVSSYALHHLTDRDKRQLLHRCFTWLRPGGRIVITDMMFGRGLAARDRAIFVQKAKRLIRKGPGGWKRLVKNVVRFGLRRGSELPSTPAFWTCAMEEAGFIHIVFEDLVGEAGLVRGERFQDAPMRAA